MVGDRRATERDFILPHPRYKDGGIFDKGEESFF
jgi:hypothetical protein